MAGIVQKFKNAKWEIGSLALAAGTFGAGFAGLSQFYGTSAKIDAGLTAFFLCFGLFAAKGVKTQVNNLKWSAANSSPNVREFVQAAKEEAATQYEDGPVMNTAYVAANLAFLVAGLNGLRNADYISAGVSTSVALCGFHSLYSSVVTRMRDNAFFKKKTPAPYPV
ncbi:MAG: hypothetical protein PHE27_04780 [Alphaproteobacteria bacterium]|nr:hypothetical protein [Alphaproteobacteria bacterium]